MNVCINTLWGNMKFKLNKNQWTALSISAVVATAIIVPAIVFGTVDFSTPYVIVMHDSELHDNSFNEQAYNASTRFAEDYNETAGFYDVDPLNEKAVSSNVDQ